MLTPNELFGAGQLSTGFSARPYPRRSSRTTVAPCASAISPMPSVLPLSTTITWRNKSAGKSSSTCPIEAASLRAGMMREIFVLSDERAGRRRAAGSSTFLCSSPLTTLPELRRGTGRETIYLGKKVASSPAERSEAKIHIPSSAGALSPSRRARDRPWAGRSLPPVRIRRWAWWRQSPSNPIPLFGKAPGRHPA